MSNREEVFKAAISLKRKIGETTETKKYIIFFILLLRQIDFSKKNAIDETTDASVLMILLGNGSEEIIQSRLKRKKSRESILKKIQFLNKSLLR